MAISLDFRAKISKGPTHVLDQITNLSEIFGCIHLQKHQVQPQSFHEQNHHLLQLFHHHNYLAVLKMRTEKVLLKQNRWLFNFLEKRKYLFGTWYVCFYIFVLKDIFPSTRQIRISLHNRLKPFLFSF